MASPLTLEGASIEEEPADEPLIICSRATRRLELLLRQGVDLTPRIREACPSHLWGRKDGGQQPPPPFRVAGRLAAALLRSAVEVPEAESSRGDGSGQSWQLSRDPQLELAVTTNTLRLLKLSTGTLVYASNPAEPCIAPHMARVLALPPDAQEAPAPRDAVAYLAPSLAHNLGLALHLQPLLSREGAAAGSQVALHRLDGARQGDGSTSVGGRMVSLPQPGLEEAQVVVAEEVDVAVVRTPVVTALGTAHARPGGGSAVEGDGGAAAAPAADESGADLAAEALRRYLVSGTRLVCEGDVFAAPRAEHDEGAYQLLANLNRLPAGKQAAAGAKGLPAQQQSSVPPASPDLVHFKVMRLAARGGLVAAVDVDATTVRMVGSCSSGLPVGLPGYVAGMAAGGAAAAPSLSSLLPAWRQLAELLASMLHPSTARLPLRLAILLHGPAGSGKRSAVAAAAAAVGCHLVALSCHDFRSPNSSDKQVLEGLRTAFEAAAAYRPLVLSLQHFETLAEGSQDPGSFTAKAASVLSECILEGCRGDPRLLPGKGSGVLAGMRSPLVLVACADAVEGIPASLRRCFTHEIHVEAPAQEQRRQLLESKLGSAVASAQPGVLNDAAQHTAGLLPRELAAVAADACALAAMDTELVPAIMSAAADGALPAHREAPSLTSQHLNLALESVRQRMSTDIGAPAIPNVTWQDVGGLEDVKRAILDTVELPLKHPILFARGLRRRSGVLLYGPPGTGKTLLAKAVATECKINFLSVKGPELINMYVGESERQIREVFARARQARPCVVFFDELDSLAPARGKGSDSGGVMDRVVSQLLAEVDGMQAGDGGGDVFIIGATNRPDLLDAAMLRPGRLDKLLYVGIAEDAGSKGQVLRALTRKFRLHEDVDLGAIAAACPARFTGADMYALSADAWMVAFRRGVAEREAAARTAAVEGGIGGDGEGEEVEEEVEVGQADFNAALGSLQPSLSEEEIRRYERIREQYESR